MTKRQFRKLCDKYQFGEYSDGFDIQGLLNELEEKGEGEWDDLNSHDSLKEWLKYCIDEEYHIGNFINQWFEEGFADYYKVDFSMGTLAKVVALATADDFYEAFEDRFD